MGLNIRRQSLTDFIILLNEESQSNFCVKFKKKLKSVTEGGAVGSVWAACM